MKSLILIIVSFGVLLHAEKQADKINPIAILDSVITLTHSQPQKALRLSFKILEQDEEDIPDSTLYSFKALIATILRDQGYPAQAMKYYVDVQAYLNKVGDSFSPGWVSLDMGNIYFHQELYHQAQERYTSAFESFRITGNLFGQATAVNNLALIAIEKGNFNKAMTHFNEALELRIQYKKEPYLIAHSYNYIADLYLRMGNMKEAMAYYQKVIDIGITEGAGNVRGLSLQAMGDIYFKMDEKQTAIEHFRLAEESFISDYNPKYLAELYIRLAEIYETEGVADSAVKYLNKALPIVEQHRFVKLNISVLNQLIELNEDLGKQEKILSYYEQLNHVIQSRYKTELRQSLERAEIQLELSMHKQKLGEKEIQLNTTKQQRNFAIITGFLLFLLIWMLYRRYEQNKKLTEKEKQIAIDKQKAISELLDLKKKELVNKTMCLVQKNDLISNINHEIHYLYDILDAKKEDHLFNSLYSLTDSALHSEEDWISFEEQFSTIFPLFFAKLSKEYPTLKAKDIKFCAYLKLDMSTNDIAKLMGISIRSVESRRYRLRKEMKLAKGINLSHLIKDM